MHVLVVLAHPVPESFAASVAETVVSALRAGGHSVDLLDLYREGFEPSLTDMERRAYMQPGYDPVAVRGEVERLQAADGLILVFPQWWFNMPAILKGFIDRVFAPDIAFIHDPEGGRIRPGLTRLRFFWTVTSTGSPWWVVHLYMGNPLRRILKRGVATFCGKGLSFRSLNLYDMDRATAQKRVRFLEKVRRAVSRLS